MHDNNAVAAAAAEHDHDHDHDECSALPKKKIMSSSSLLSSLDRRHFLFRGPATAAATAVAAATALSVLAVLAVLVHQPQQAQARGLVKFPVDDPTVLLNSYHFLRVGDTLLEDEDIWSTNPLFLTNREAALSPTTGIEQMQKAAQQMEQAQRTPGIIKFSLAASCIDSSNVIGNVFNLGRDRIVPEFTFLDPRGIGQWEMFRYSSTKPAVWALDVMEAGAEGTGGRPPANQDGTPNETLADQAVRLRQVMSQLETFYSGETILLIFPDGTGPALLSALIAGIPLNRVHELEFGPGELRMDVTKASVMQTLQEKAAGKAEYDKIIATGQEELDKLRSTNKEDIVSLKDQNLEAERIAIDNATKEREAQRIEIEKQKEEGRGKRLELLRQQEAEGGGLRNNNQLAAAAAAAVVGLAGIFAASASGSEEDTTSKQAAETSSRNPNGSGQSVLDAWPDDRQDTDHVDASAVEVQAAMTPSTTTLEPLEPTIDPREAAEKAMEEYLDRDDGAEDWLSVMASIVDEEEDTRDDSESESAVRKEDSEANEPFQ